MEVIEHVEISPRPPEGCAVTIGNFDGVHEGHQAVIRRLEELAEPIGASTAVVTFDPHTLQVLRPERAPQLLTSLDRKLDLLEATGLDYTLVLDFDAERAAQAPADFVREILAGCLHARVLLVGDDFRFGHKARGDVALLREMGADLGFRVEPIHMVSGPHGAYSSTAARLAVSEGRMDDAAEALARPHDLRGEVIHGDERGRRLGFPTANVAPDENMCVPPNGVYAGRLRTVPGGEWCDAVVNLGVRPTFRASGDDSSTRPLVEAHVFDFDADLYGRIVDVAFAERMRDERRFGSVDELKAQIAADASAARSLLAAGGGPR